MPTNTYTALATITLTSTDTAIDFQNIPGTYRDLVLVVRQIVNTGETDVRFNTDDGNNYTTVTMRGGADSGYYSATFTANGIKPQNSAGGTDSLFILQIMDYSATDKHKVTLMRSGAGSSSSATSVQAHAVRWANTAAINRVRVLSVDGGTYQIGSTFSLYGIASQTMQLIQTVTVGSGGAANITFSSIPATYTDLVIVTSARSNRSGQVDDQLQMRFNGSTSGYSERGLFGNGSSPTTFSNSSQTSVRDIIWTTASNATSNTFGNGTLYIPNYAGSLAKFVLSDSVTENNATAASQAIMSGLWTGTDPISSIVLSPLNGSLINEYSSASLYGILKGSDGIVTVS